MASARAERAAGWRMFRAGIGGFITLRRARILRGSAAAATGVGALGVFWLMSLDPQTPLITLTFVVSCTLLAASVAACTCVYTWSMRDRSGFGPAFYFTDTVTREIARARKAGETPEISPGELHRLEQSEQFLLRAYPRLIAQSLAGATIFLPLALLVFIPPHPLYLLLSALSPLVQGAIADMHLRSLGRLSVVYPDAYDSVTPSTPNDPAPKVER